MVSSRMRRKITLESWWEKSFAESVVAFLQRQTLMFEFARAKSEWATSAESVPAGGTPLSQVDRSATITAIPTRYC